MSGSARRAPIAGKAVQGVTLISLAKVVFLVCGYAVHVVATRVLETELYGSLVVALSVVAWVKVGLSQTYIPGACKIISEDPRRLSATLAGVGGRYLRFAGLVAVTLAVSAPLAGSLFNDETLTPLLVVAGLEVFLFSMVALSRQILSALRRFLQTAAILALYGIGRAVGACLLMLVGWQAVGGMIGLSAGAALAGGTGLLWVLSSRRDFEEAPYPEVLARCREWTAATLPSGLGMMALISLDMWLVKALMPNGPEIGIYGAAFALSRLPIILVQGLTEATFSRVSGALAAEERALARSVAAESMRFLLIVFVPLWAVVAGSSQGLMVFLFGTAYRGSAALLDILFAAVVFAAVFRQVTVLLAACDRPQVRLRIVAALLPLAFGLNFWLIPRLGTAGGALAALVTTAVGAVAAGIVLNRRLGVFPPVLSVLRCTAAGAAVLALGRWWALSGWLSLLQCAALGTIYLVLLALMRELHSGDLKDVFRALRPGDDGAS